MTATQEIEKTVCRHCFAVLDVGDNFCRHCGAPLGGMDGNSTVPDRADPDRSGHPADRSAARWIVLAGFVLFLGPLALPMLWRSRQFPTVWKIVLTVLVLAVIALIVGLVWYVFYKSLEPLRHLQQLQGH